MYFFLLNPHGVLTYFFDKNKKKNQTFLFNFVTKNGNFFGKHYEICLNLTSLFILLQFHISEYYVKRQPPVKVVLFLTAKKKKISLYFIVTDFQSPKFKEQVLLAEDSNNSHHHKFFYT